MSYPLRFPLLFAASLTAALSALSASGDVRAGTSTTTATDNCNGALPGYEGALRKRPLGISNEGTVHAFVSCGSAVNESESDGSTSAVVFMINRGAAAQAVTCTFVDGLPVEFSAFSSSLPVAVFRTKAIAILPGVMNFIQWTPSEFGLDVFSKYGSFTCDIPPKVEINVAGIAWASPV